MTFVHDYVFHALWGAYIAYWWIMATRVKTTERIEGGVSRSVRMVVMLSAVLLLGLPRLSFSILDGRFLPDCGWSYWAGASITALAMAFGIWARQHLGRNWSQAVAVKLDHELITSGPYALVRHPIYSGLLLAILGTAIARGEWRGLLAVVLVFAVLWHKLMLEEKWMHAEFGAAYADYCKRVAALVPFLV